MWFPCVSQIIYEISADITWAVTGAQCLILCLKKIRLSEFFISFCKFSHRAAPIVLIVSKPNLSVPIFILVTVTPDLKSWQAFQSNVNISSMVGEESPILTLYISVSKYLKFV